MKKEAGPESINSRANKILAVSSAETTRYSWIVLDQRADFSPRTIGVASRQTIQHGRCPKRTDDKDERRSWSIPIPLRERPPACACICSCRNTRRVRHAPPSRHSLLPSEPLRGRLPSTALDGSQPSRRRAAHAQDAPPRRAGTARHARRSGSAGGPGRTWSRSAA